MQHHPFEPSSSPTVAPGSPLARSWAAARQYGLPIAAGYFPVAAAFGLLARQSGLSIVEAVFLSIWVYAGASQFLVVGMVAAGLPWSSWLVAGAFMNLRHILFAVSMVPQWQGWPRLQRALASFGLTDEVYAVVASQKGRFEQFPEVAGTALTAYLSWIGGTVVGAWGSVAFPPALAKPLEFALPALFLALLVPSLTTRPTALAALVGGSVSLAVSLMGQGSWGIVLGGVLGALVGGLAATSRRRGEARGREEGEAG
ncbi:MAG TPA: AzlC family ABC transporter permease [Limnochorda sp.]